MDMIGFGARDEFLKRLVDDLSLLITEAEDVTIEKESFRRFSKYVDHLRALLQDLRAKRVYDKPEWAASSSVLQKLHSEVRKARDIIKAYNSGSRLQLLLKCKTMLSQLKKSADEIASIIQQLSLAKLDSMLQLKSKADEIIHGMWSVEFKSAAATEAIVSEIEESIAQNSRSQDHTMRLLHQIADAVGAAPNVSLVRSEIALLKQEKEEMEAQKQHAEALQLSQLIHLLYSSEMITSPPPESPTIMSPRNYLINSFTCPLSCKLMEDPVAIVCGHSFERNAILEYFRIGMKVCPTCNNELSSLDVTQNISLRSSIQEWKQRNAKLRLQSAVSSLDSDDHEVLNEALEILLAVMENTSYIAEVSQHGIAARLVDLLKTGEVNTKAALKCICHLAHYSEENKKTIAAKGVIRCIVKQFCRGETEPEGLVILLELSENEVFADMIGKTKDSIPCLVSLLQNSNPDISQKALNVLGNLSCNINFVIKMAEAGYFEPFLACFQQGNSETRANMAKELTRMHLWESTARHFDNERFISALTKTLYSSSQDYKLKCLGCIKKLLAFPRLVRKFLSDRNTIPALHGLIQSTISNQQLKQEAMEILLLLVEASEPNDYQTNPSLEELHSQHNINVFLQLASTANTQIKASFLHLLLLMAQKSENARLQIRSDQSVIAHLFSILEGDSRREVRVQVLKLTCSIAEGHPAGVQLPPSPLKETAIATLLNIFTSSTNTEERSAAAGIIGRLPSDDTTINEMLCKSETLKAIHEVVCANDSRYQGMSRESPSPLATTSNCLLENTLAVLLRYTEPNKPELQRQVSKLNVSPSLIHVLSTGSSLAKQRAAIALYHLSQSSHPDTATTTAMADQAQGFFLLFQFRRLLQLKSWCGSSTAALHQSLCTVHGSACSSRHALCLVEAGAVGPLVQTVVSELATSASEAALVALDTLLKDDAYLSSAAAVIVENQGMTAILEVLDKGRLSTKEVALDLFYKILRHSEIAREQSLRSRGILISLLRVDQLKKKAALVLSQMDAIPHQSSYF
ncbi:U-box domain-containing protein 44 isoform X1 [Elaeis guineensis]|uniref:RING-type E3 ubiquitin transferase n=1 Tax=Elaeis guineensis var. tenera TaxID=51953 RepID=A0A6J0PMT6_ELAGV|nr:U-box domain-containing protein 44 [Elaeis guineensis]XP_019708440.1 U-box domain-containing protein 44 [Elaeis guineensis]XP_029122242.1 U-box domain-containing protein 44 [Elaeis guineensis]